MSQFKVNSTSLGKIFFSWFVTFVSNNHRSILLAKVSEGTESESEVSRSSTPKVLSMENRIHASTSSLPNQNISPSNSLDKSSGTSTPTLSKAISITSVFSRSQSQHRDSISGGGAQFPGQSLFDRLTTEAKDMAREAKAVAKEVVTKPAAQAGKKKILANLQAISEPVKGSAKEFWKSSRDEDPTDVSGTFPPSSSSSSIMSSMSSDFNGLADKTAGMLSGFFNATKNSNFASKMREKAQPFGPFPKGKKGSVEKSTLIKHTNSQAAQFATDQKNQNHK